MRVVASRVRLFAQPRPSVLLALTDEAGNVGFGDAAPLPPFSREDAATCARLLEGIHERLPPTDDALSVAPSAFFALETALLDLALQARGKSLVACLGGESPKVAVNALLLAPPVETLADRVAALAREGCAAIKIKLRAADDQGFARELAALHEVRARLPAPFEIRLDPNAAWPLDVARRRLDQLAPIAPRFVEQPVAPGSLHLLGACAVPWAADESLADPVEIESLLEAPGCAVFVLKPAILGGYRRARALAQRAQERGLDVVITHLFDGPYALAACTGLAMVLPRPPLACGLARHEHLTAFADAFGLDLPPLLHPWTTSASPMPRATPPLSPR